MDSRPEVVPTEEAVNTQEPQELQEPLLNAMTSQTPWWIVSILFHTLAIALCGLVSMALKVPEADMPIVMDGVPLTPAVQVALPQEQPVNPLKPGQKSPFEPDPNCDTSDIQIDPRILSQAVVGDHIETVNPELPDSHEAFGNPDARCIYDRHGVDDAAGGSGTPGSAAMLEDIMIGVGKEGPGGSGNGWSTGNGTGEGPGDGPGKGTWGHRGKGSRIFMIKKYNPSRDVPGIRKGTDFGLRWLADHQEPDGRWDSAKYGGQKVDTANTALALLCFLGAGHTDRVGEYKDNVRRAVAWLKSKQAANGLIFDTTDAGGARGIGYPGAIATMAMAEAAGMGMKDAREAAQHAVDYCVNIHQEGQGSERGGFRYTAKSAGDISVTGWFVMALKSARVAGLKVDPFAFDGVLRFLDRVEVKTAGNDSGYGPASRYAYTPGSGSNPRRCAIGNLIREFMGSKKEELESSVELFVREGGLPDWGANGEKTDLYYWYYGTFCTFQQGGAVWKNWNEALKKALLNNQCMGGDEKGSWTPVGAFSGDWGRVGQTALSTLCLEVYYRYDQLGAH